MTGSPTLAVIADRVDRHEKRLDHVEATQEEHGKTLAVVYDRVMRSAAIGALIGGAVAACIAAIVSGLVVAYVS